MRLDVTVWAIAALVLMSAETLIPGAFLLWMGIAASVVFVCVLLMDNIPVLVQVSTFVLFSFLSIQVYRKWMQGSSCERDSTTSTLNRRAAQHIGKIIALERAIVGGHGRVKIGDAFWIVEGPDLAEGTRVRVIDSDGVNLKVEAMLS